MLPRLATFVEVSDATEFVAADTTFVWAKAALPQDNATDEMTAKYNLRFLFFLSANFFINFNGLNFQTRFREFLRIRALRNAARHRTKNFNFLEMISNEANRTVRNRRIMKRREGRAGHDRTVDFQLAC